MLFRARWARKPTTICGRSQPSLSTALAAPTANTLPVKRSTRLATTVAESTAAAPAWKVAPAPTIFQKVAPNRRWRSSGGNIERAGSSTRAPDREAAPPQHNEADPDHEHDGHHVVEGNHGQRLRVRHAQDLERKAGADHKPAGHPHESR